MPFRFGKIVIKKIKKQKYKNMKFLAGLKMIVRNNEKEKRKSYGTKV